MLPGRKALRKLRSLLWQAWTGWIQPTKACKESLCSVCMCPDGPPTCKPDAAGGLGSPRGRCIMSRLHPEPCPSK